MDFDYYLGLSTTVIIGFLLIIFSLVLIFILNKKTTAILTEFTRDANWWFSITFLLTFAIGLVLTFIIMLYPLVNLVSQPLKFTNVDFFKTELEKGILPLRISSLLIGFRLVIIVFRLLISQDIAEKFEMLTYKLFQYFFYIVPLASLWFFTINGDSSIPIVLLSWSIFFILDDWNIIDDYTREFKSKPLGSHALRIFGFNIIIFVLCAVCLFTKLNLILAVFLLLIFLFLGFALFVTSYSEKAFGPVLNPILNRILKVKAPNALKNRSNN